MNWYLSTIKLWEKLIVLIVKQRSNHASLYKNNLFWIWMKLKKYLNVFFQTWYPFYYFYHIPKTRLENKYMHAQKKRIVNFMNNAHKKLKCIKGLLILWITCCCLFQKIYQIRKECESYHTSQLPEHHNNQRPIPRMDTNIRNCV